MTAIERAFLEAALKDATVSDAVPASLGEVETDTRQLTPGAVFVALRGDNFDGHRFVEAALEEGAAAAVVARDAQLALPEGAPLVEVEDTLVALQALATHRLMTSSARRVAVTGSNGKTSTKELILAALSGVYGEGRVHATAGNFNNHVGLPLTALKLAPTHDAVVLEMGMNHLREIERLCEIARPEVAVITNVGPAHAGNVGGIEGVAKAKGEIFFGLDEGGIAVANADDPRVMAQAALAGRRTLTFGTAADADVRVSDVAVRDSGGVSAQVYVGGASYPLEVAHEGAHSALNAAAALAVVLALELDITRALDGLRAAAVPKGRLVRKRSSSGALIVDDTYNANPESMRVGFDTLAKLAGGRRQVVVLGEMLELGETAADDHAATAAAAVASGVTRVFACGALGQSYVTGARAAGLGDDDVTWAEDAAALAPLVVDAVGADDVVLVKGSRGARMERVVHALVPEGGA